MSEAKITPAELAVLIICYMASGPIGDDNGDIVRRFAQDRLIEPYPAAGSGYYRTTEKGSAWMELILSTPKPVSQWVDPRSVPRGTHVRGEPL